MKGWLILGIVDNEKGVNCYSSYMKDG